MIDQFVYMILEGLHLWIKYSWKIKVLLYVGILKNLWILSLAMRIVIATHSIWGNLIKQRWCIKITLQLFWISILHQLVGSLLQALLIKQSEYFHSIKVDQERFIILKGCNKSTQYCIQWTIDWFCLDLKIQTLEFGNQKHLTKWKCYYQEKKKLLPTTKNYCLDSSMIPRSKKYPDTNISQFW